MKRPSCLDGQGSPAASPSQGAESWIPVYPFLSPVRRPAQTGRATRRPARGRGSPRQAENIGTARRARVMSPSLGRIARRGFPISDARGRACCGELRGEVLSRHRERGPDEVDASLARGRLDDALPPCHGIGGVEEHHAFVNERAQGDGGRLASPASGRGALFLAFAPRSGGLEPPRELPHWERPRRATTRDLRRRDRRRTSHRRRRDATTEGARAARPRLVNLCQS